MLHYQFLLLFQITVNIGVTENSDIRVFDVLLQDWIVI